MAHELQRFFKDLRDAVFDVAGEVLGDLVVQVDDADGLGHVANVFRVPDGHFVFCPCVVSRLLYLGRDSGCRERRWLWPMGFQGQTVVVRRLTATPESEGNSTHSASTAQQLQ